jgi:hypothetical protein
LMCMIGVQSSNSPHSFMFCRSYTRNACFHCYLDYQYPIRTIFSLPSPSCHTAPRPLRNSSTQTGTVIIGTVALRLRSRRHSSRKIAEGIALIRIVNGHKQDVRCAVRSRSRWQVPPPCVWWLKEKKSL